MKRLLLPSQYGWALFLLMMAACSHIGGYLETKGLGLPPKNIENRAENQFERRAKCRDAALIQAQFEMLSILKGVHLEGGTTVENAMATDSKIKATVDDVLRGAKIESTEWDHDDTCIVTLRISKARIKRMMGVKL